MNGFKRTFLPTSVDLFWSYAMGLEAINFAYVPPESKKDLVLKEFSNYFDAIPRIGNQETKFIIKSEDYLIDFLIRGGKFSARIALCCSAKSVEKTFEIFKSISQRYIGGYLEVVQSRQVIVNFNEDDLRNMLGTFEERRTVFLDHIADLSDVALSSDEVFKYIRTNEIKPRVNQTL